MPKETEFGNFPAAKVLSERLDRLENRKLARRVRHFVNTTLTGFARLDGIDSQPWFKRFALIWRNRRLAACSFHPDVDSYAKAVIRTHFKWWISPDERD